LRLSAFSKKRPNANNWSWRPLKFCVNANSRRKRSKIARPRSLSSRARNTNKRKLIASAKKTRTERGVWLRRKPSSRLRMHARPKNVRTS